MRAALNLSRCRWLIWVFLAVLASPARGQDGSGDEARRLRILAAAVREGRRDIQSRIRACEQLEALGPKAKPALPDLIAAMQYAGHQLDVNFDSDAGLVLRSRALRAVMAIHPEAKEVVPTLIQSLKDLHNIRSYYIKEYLNKFVKPDPDDLGRRGYTYFDSLAAESKADSLLCPLAREIIASLGKMGTEARDSIPALLSCLQEMKAQIVHRDHGKYYDLVYDVISSLGVIATRDDEAVLSALEDIELTGTVPALTKAAVQALEKIRQRRP